MKTTNQVEYKILSRTKITFLEEDVAEWTADGYHLVGGVSVHLNRQGETVFVQAIAR